MLLNLWHSTILYAEQTNYELYHFFVSFNKVKLPKNNQEILLCHCDGLFVIGQVCSQARVKLG